MSSKMQLSMETIYLTKDIIQNTREKEQENMSKKDIIKYLSKSNPTKYRKKINSNNNASKKKQIKMKKQMKLIK